MYGTLKPNHRNFHIAESAGALTAKAGYIEPFDLFHLDPEGYPAVVAGSGRVHGFLLEFSDLARALPPLDELEGALARPPWYRRERVRVLPHGHLAHVYLYARTARLRRPGAKLLAGGVWDETPSSA